MSAIIKSNSLAELSTVRPLSAISLTVPLGAASRQDEERERLRRRIAVLEGEVRQREEKISGLQADVERAFEDGKGQGHKVGFAEAEDLQAERLSLLETAARQAHQGLVERISSLERLAPLLARECLETMLGDADNRLLLVEAIIATQLCKIEKSVLLGIEVSQEDFPDEIALSALATRIGLSVAALTARSDMPSGGCAMSLRLGRMDVGIDQQWGVLKDLLSTLAEPAGAT